MQKGRKSLYSTFAYVDKLIDVTFKTLVLLDDHWVRGYPFMWTMKAMWAVLGIKSAASFPFKKLSNNAVLAGGNGGPRHSWDKRFG